MGSPASEWGREADEGPQHETTIKSFALARTEVTFYQWKACVEDGGCKSNLDPDDRGWGRGQRPVIDVSWGDAQEYITWLNTKVEGEPYRLPSEAEWEYAARAGTKTWSFPWTDEANYNGTYVDCPDGPGEYRGKTVPVVVLDAANAWGLRHMHGNVAEWVADCWHDSYAGAPDDGSTWLDADGGDCSRRMVRGGSWANGPQILRSANRSMLQLVNRDGNLGFRPARTLPTHP